MRQLMRTLQASSEIESLHWLNYADRDKISVDQLIYKANPFVRLIRTSAILYFQFKCTVY
jgi:hypothetical protein